MTAPAPPAMSDKALDEIEARWNAYIAGNATARADMAAMIREVRRLRSAASPGVVVPKIKVTKAMTQAGWDALGRLDRGAYPADIHDGMKHVFKCMLKAATKDPAP